MEAKPEHVEQEPASSSSVETLSPRGISAMQGAEERLPDNPSRARDEVQVEQLSLQDRYHKGVEYAVNNAEVGKEGLGAYRKVCGAVGEGVYLDANGGSVGLVNDLNEHLGNHNRIFDGSSSMEMASIKTFVTGRNEPYGAYARGFREMIGQAEPQKLDFLSQELWALRAEEPEKWAAIVRQLPSGIGDASGPADLRERLVDSAVMRIPADHVERMRSYIVRAAMRRPELYGLDPLLPHDKVDVQSHMLAGKVRPIAPDVTAHDIRIMSGHAYRRRFKA
jgi:hypothetical protein